MRKGFDSLCALVTEQLARNPLSGDVFLFLSRDRIRAKVLHFDGTGLCLYVKRLERGRFAALWREAGADPVTLTVSEEAVRDRRPSLQMPGERRIRHEPDRQEQDAEHPGLAGHPQRDDTAARGD